MTLPAQAPDPLPPQPPGPTASQLSSKWVLVAGLIFGGLTFLTFAGLVIASVLGKSVPPDSRFLVVILLAVGLALSGSFLGGTATASGRIPLPGGLDPVTFSAAGGIAIFAIVLLLGYAVYARDGNDSVVLSGNVLDEDTGSGVPNAVILIKTDTGTFDRQAVDNGDFSISDIPHLFNKQVTVSAKAENYRPTNSQTVLVGSYHQQFKLLMRNCYNGFWHETDNYHLWDPNTKGNQWSFKVTANTLHIYRTDGFVSGDFQRGSDRNWTGDLSWGNGQKTPGMLLHEPNADCDQIVTNQFWSYRRDTLK